MDPNANIYYRGDGAPIEDRMRLDKSLMERSSEVLKQMERLEKQMAQPVTITYDHPERGHEERLVTPSHLFLGHSPHHPMTKHACWYLQAYCHNKRGNRHFPMHRISSWGEGDTREQGPHGDEGEPDAQP